MSGKEQFEKLQETMKFITKDSEMYRLIYFDGENGICRYKKVGRRRGVTDSNQMSYEKACELFTIEIVENPPTPDQYFFMKINENDNDNVRRTVSDRTLISYLKSNLESCGEVIEKLQEIVQTHEDYEVRKASYTTLKTLQIEGYENLKEYTVKPKGKKKGQSDNSLKLDAMSVEKALLVYMALVRKYKDKRSNIIYSKFSNTWDEMFPNDNGELRKLKLRAFAAIKDNFDDKSYEEIKAYREKFVIYEGTEVPTEAKKLAQEKGVIVALAENRDKYLSGFDVLVKEGKNQTFRIVQTPFGLKYDKLMSMLNKMPTKAELKEKEQRLMNMLTTNGGCTDQQKTKVVDQYKAPYATHEFKKFMNSFTIYECKSKTITNACVNLCHRVGIRRLDTNGYILYKYCEGSGQRKKNIKRIRKIRKNNRKGKK